MSVIYKHGRKYSFIIAENRPKKVIQFKHDAFCGRFFCNIMDEAVCCCGCPKVEDCDFACLNSPEKCGLCIGPEEN